MANIAWQSDSQQFEEIEYRYPIYNSSSMSKIDCFEQMDKKVPRGTFICRECFSITGDVKKSAVMLKGGTGKVCLHVSHYANKQCGADSPVHNCIKKAYATYLGGEWEKRYPGSNFSCDARVKDAYYEFELTSRMTEGKQEFIKKFMRQNSGVIYTLSLVTKQFKSLLPEMWEAWSNSNDLGNNDWCAFWYLKTYPLLKRYNVRDYVGKKSGAAQLQPKGTVDVGHSDVMLCNLECKYFHGSQESGKQMSFFSHCDLAKAHNLPIINSRCIFGMEKSNA